MANKSQSVLSSEKARVELRQKFHAIAKGEKAPDENVKITRNVSGGPPGHRLSQHVEILGNGEVQYEVLDELRDKETRKYSMTLNKSSLASVFKTLDNVRLLELKEEGRGFIPDSLVGSITVEIDGNSRTYYYLADETDRRVQGKILKQPLAAVEKMMERVEQRAIKRDEATQLKLDSKLQPRKTPPK